MRQGALGGVENLLGGSRTFYQSLQRLIGSNPKPWSLVAGTWCKAQELGGRNRSESASLSLEYELCPQPPDKNFCNRVSQQLFSPLGELIFYCFPLSFHPLPPVLTILLPSKLAVPWLHGSAAVLLVPVCTLCHLVSASSPYPCRTRKPYWKASEAVDAKIAEAPEGEGKLLVYSGDSLCESHHFPSGAQAPSVSDSAGQA